MSFEESLAREHIRDTMARYNIAGDGNDFRAFVDLFTDDAVFEAAVFRCEGKSAIEAYFSKRPYADPSAPGPRFRRHNLTTSQIDLTGPNSASARTYYVVYTDLGPDHCGYYVDRYRQEKGRWLIAYRGVWMDWSHPASRFVPEVCKQMVAEKGTCGPSEAMSGR
jgi:ketosteroid isomerase-like protein